MLRSKEGNMQECGLRGDYMRFKELKDVDQD